MPSSRRSPTIPNLDLRLNARVRRIEIENGRAVGVTYRDAKGAEHRAFADGEVIVAAGALVTPQLLMLSGIGPADQLRTHGIRLHRRPARRRREPDRPPRGADRRHGQWPVRLLPAGRRLAHAPQRPAVQALRLRPDPLGRRRGRRLRQPDRSAMREPTIQAFCVPIVYLDRDTLGLVDGHLWR